MNAPSRFPLNEAGNDSWSVSVSVVNFSLEPFFDDDLLADNAAVKLSRECSLEEEEEEDVE